MAEVSSKVIRPSFEGKLKTINEFRKTNGKGISSQAIDYAIKNDLIDYIQFGDRVRVIVLTPKTLEYVPNDSPKRPQPVKRERKFQVKK